MQRFEKYSGYKDSGVDWLGEIPAGWEVQYGFTFLFESKERNDGMKSHTVLSLSYGKIRVKANRELTGLVPESFETYQLVKKGDIIFRPTDLQNDHTSLRSGISDFDGIITSAYVNLRIRPVADTKFVSYIFRCIDNNKIIYGLGSGLRQNITYRDFRRFLFPFPTLQEQTAIANFLDEKTTKIDTAIAQKEQMISLLKERKQILIQNAVIKGIDPDAQMKDSGVEWIGEIPEGWILGKLGHFATVNNGSTPSRTVQKYWVNGTVGWLSSGKVNDKIVNEPSEFITKKAVSDCSLKIFPKLTVLMGIVGQGKTRGTTTLLNIEATINQNMVGIIPNVELNSYFLHYFMVQGYYAIRGGNGSNQEALNCEIVRNIKMPIPPVIEQTAIVNFIETESAKIDTSITLQQQQITKLKEYKTILIDNAVTGKIKVA